jgi:hypothetical protein
VSGPYGTAGANSANVPFPFETGLQAARDLWQLADEVISTKGKLATKETAALVDWAGPKRHRFTAMRDEDGTAASTAATGLRELARSFATAWSQARGQQDRINFARYVQHETDSDSTLENVGEFFTGEDDYGDPPENPPVPSAPGFHATRQPIHPEFGP